MLDNCWKDLVRMETSSIKPPGLMKLSSKLVVNWVDGMGGSAPSYQDELGPLCRLEKVGGLGAKIIPNATKSSSADPVERKLQIKLNAIKKKSAEDSKIMNPADGNGVEEEDEDEPESRIKALAKKRTQVAALPQRSAKKTK